MSEGMNEARWSLADDELEALMSGATAEDLARVGNPVAEFFSDARSARTIAPPQPGPELRRLFASGLSAASATGEHSPALVDTNESSSAPDPQLDRTISGPPAREESHLLSGPAPSQPVVRYEPAYSRPVVELFADLLRPTGTKLLMAAAMLALVVAAGPAIGLYDLGSESDGGVNNQAIGDLDLTDTTDSAEPSLPQGEDDPAFGAAAAEETVTTEVAAPAATERPATTSSAAAPTTTAQEVTSTTAPPTSATTTAPDTSETTTTIANTTTIEPPTTVARTQPSSGATVVETTVTTIVDTTTTTETTRTPASATLQPGVAYSVPAQRPVGSYRASVPGGDGCVVQVTRGGGGKAEYSAAAGEVIVFPLTAGDTVVVAAGCPTTYLVV